MIKVKMLLLVIITIFFTACTATKYENSSSQEVTQTYSDTKSSRALKRIIKEQRVALVIGNDNYNNKKLHHLDNPVNDARAMNKALAKLGFYVYYGENLTVRDMNKKLTKFSKRLKMGGVGLFFFAGHGIETDGENYLMGKDSSIDEKEDVSYESLELRKVLDKMQNSGDRLNIVLLDACRSNPFGRGSGGGLAKTTAKGTFIAYATSPGDIAEDGTGKNGVFTAEILKNINKVGLPIERVFKNVKVGVLDATNSRQRPWTNSDITGDFFFRLPQKSTRVEQKSSYSFSSELPTQFSLTVHPSPRDAKIYITNIKPRYYDGIKLKKGSYTIKVKRAGYLTKVGTVELSGVLDIDVVLEKKKVVYKAKLKPQKRYSSSKDVTVIDGLMWQDEKYTKAEKEAYMYNNWKGRNYGKVQDWKGAINYCRKLTLAGYYDWRLPNKETLKRLYNNKNKLKNLASYYYWSSSENVSFSSDAWFVYFNDGYTYSFDKRNEYYVRCVRGRQ